MALLRLYRSLRHRLNVILLVLLTCVVVLPVIVYYINPYGVNSDNIRSRLFGFDIYRIPSSSMMPLLAPGDYILVSNTAYLSEAPKRDDVVVFWETSKARPKKVAFIKRVVATAGESIKIKDGQMFINGKSFEENYVSEGNKRKVYSHVMEEQIISQGQSFVMGDNRDNSNDSRLFGAISNQQIIGKATSILYGKNNRSGSEIK